MKVEPDLGLHCSGTRVRPTLAGWALLGGVVFVAFAAASWGLQVSYGFTLILLGVMGIDLALGYVGVAWRKLSVKPLVTEAEAPARLAIEVAAARGVVDLAVTPISFSPLDAEVWIEPTVLSAGESDPVPVYYPVGAFPFARRYVRFVLAASPFGLVTAHRSAVFVAAGLFARVPALESTDRPISAMALDEVGRLREYVPGDRRSRVSWPASARTGSLHVRASSAEDAAEVVVVLDLGPLAQILGLTPASDIFEELNRTVLLGGAVVMNLLDQGVAVNLRTVEVVDDFKRRDALQAAQDPAVIAGSVISEQNYRVRLVDGLVHNRAALVRRLANCDLGFVARPAGPYIEVTHDGISERS